MRTPTLLRKAWVRASVLDMDNENTSLAAIMVNGTSEPSDCAIPTGNHVGDPKRVDNPTGSIPSAIAVLPVEGGPANKIALPAIFPSCTIFKIIPAALRAFPCPTIPCEFPRGSSLSSNPRPRIWECAPFDAAYFSALNCRSYEDTNLCAQI